MVGDKDPLYPESLKLLKKLVDLDKDINMIIYNEFPHGFLNFEFAITDAKICIDDTSKLIWELFNK